MRTAAFLVLVLITAILSAGVQGCPEIKGKLVTSKEYCSGYKQLDVRTACEQYCSDNKDFAGNQQLVQSCEIGQSVFLTTADKNIDDSIRKCDEFVGFDTNAQRAACRSGASVEQARYNAVFRDDPGTAAGGDRENGNLKRESKRQF